MNIYLTAKKLHRLALWTTTVFGLLQMATGLNLKYGWVNNTAVYSIHSQFGIFFGLTFLASTVTGISMYFFTLPKKLEKQKKVTDQQVNP